MTKQHALERVDAYFREGGFERELAQRVACRSVSAGTDNLDDLRAYLEDLIQPELGRLGFRCRALPNPVAGGQPFLLAERIESPAFVTVLSYGHGDVVPGHEGQWDGDASPWVMARRGDAWYGRGTADNKGQHTVNLAALREVIAARGGRLGFNIKLLFEMGEERSSPGLREVCAAHREALAADVFIASDGPRVSLGQPTLFLGSRGSAVIELSCRLRDGALHSGNWGGIMKNPATILAGALASLVDGKGRIRVPGLLPPPIPASVRDALSRLDVSSERLGRTLDDDWGEPGLTAAERLLGWNTLEVLTLEAGNAAKPVNAIPPQARAHCQLRFVVGTDWTRFAEIVRAHLDEQGFRDVEVAFLRGSPATRLDPASPWVAWAKAAVRAVTGEDPAVVPNLGGTVPNDAFSDILGLPTVWVPHSYPGCRQHAANEHLPLAIVEEGLRMMVSLFWELGEAGAVQARDAARA